MSIRGLDHQVWQMAREFSAALKLSMIEFFVHLGAGDKAANSNQQANDASEALQFPCICRFHDSFLPSRNLAGQWGEVSV